VQKLKSAPQELYTIGVKAEPGEKKTFQSAPNTNKMLNFILGLVLAPRLDKKKRIPSNLGGQFATLGANVLGFSNYLLIS